MRADFDIVVVGQRGRVGYEAGLFAASLRRHAPDFAGTLYVAEPQPGTLWPHDPRLGDPALRALLTEDLNATILPFESRHFGHAYPHGNKIEALAAMPPGRPFVFFDSDTLITGPLADVPFDFARPAASLNRTGTWPVIELYGPGYEAIWGSLYRRFDLDFAASQDPAQPAEHWRRYLYFNAGWFFGADPVRFGARFADYATTVRDDPPPELVCQPLDPWLDQVALPLVIHAEGGGADPGVAAHLDGGVACHYRFLPLLYAREADAVVAALEDTLAPNRVKKVLKAHEPIRRFVLQGRGGKARALFDRDDLPRREGAIRNRLKAAGLWMR